MTMRWLALPVSLLLAAASSPPDMPSRITYVLGGIVSGPYRLSADLRSRMVEEARAPRDRPGGGRAPDPWTMPATTRRALTAVDARRIDALARAVWVHGVRSAARCPVTVPPSADALVAFEVTAPGGTHRFDDSTQCLTDQAAQLQRALHDAANP